MVSLGQNEFKVDNMLEFHSHADSLGFALQTKLSVNVDFSTQQILDSLSPGHDCSPLNSWPFIH